ncbi:E3 ubiquitin- ligase MARCH7 [Pelobates cultripes]|nr:E3 ubiquitin- ligase MARCH7 [Pelobates cultripes]
MEPKPSRLPRRITVQPSPSSLSSTAMRRGRLGVHSETYTTRDSYLRHDLDFQEPGALPTSSRDWTRERYNLEPNWKTTSSTYQRCSGTYERSLSGSLGSRSRVSAASSSSSSSTSSSSSSSPSWYEPLERAPGTYTGLHSQQQDWDSKRPKLSYTGCSSLSGIRSNTNGLRSSPDSSRYGRFPRTSSLMLGSTGPDLTRERERRTESSASVHGFTDYRHRNGDTTPSYLQDRVSSYAQGARPKENSLSTSRFNTSSLNRQLPSQHSSSLFSRDSSRNSRQGTSVEPISSQREVRSDLRHTTSRNEGTSGSILRRVSTTPRSSNEQPSDTDGRRTTRHLLSRLASSMSSTFFSRRSSQDSLNGRTPESEEAQPCLQDASQSNVVTSPSSDLPENRASDQSQGFVFLRRRLWGVSAVSPSQSSDSDADSNRSEESDTRTSGSWLPSSIRNRCTPLFSRRRREGRDETARATSTSDTSRSHNPFRRSSREEQSSSEETQRSSQGAAASSSRSPTNIATANASLADSIFSRRNSGISGMLPNSFLHFSVPAALGNTLSDNVMITVDIVPSGRSSDDQESVKSQSSSRDPEKLKKIQESLLLEDSDEEEDDLCRICQTGMSTPNNPFIQPCKCSGSLQYVHQDCMKKWLEAKINSGSSLETITTCELCKEKLSLNLEDFDLHELYQAHANERAEYEFISSGLYLVVLLHLCEQRFSDMLGAANEASSRVRFINLARTLQAHMEDLDTSEDESEDERV